MDAINTRPSKTRAFRYDNVMLVCEGKDELKWQVQAWSGRLGMFGLKTDVKKAARALTSPATLRLMAFTHFDFQVPAVRNSV